MSLADELTKLEELRRNGALSESEFSRAKAALLNNPPAASGQQLGEHLADQLAEVKCQNELARIEREWEVERQQYLIRGQYGNTMVPTRGMGIAMAAIGGGFGLLWTIVAVSMMGMMPDGMGNFGFFQWLFPLFGVFFIVIAIGYGFYVHTRAQKYQEAYEAYKAARAAVRSE